MENNNKTVKMYQIDKFLKILLLQKSAGYLDKFDTWYKSFLGKRNIYSTEVLQNI
jgi:hypothetical protein